MVHQRRRQSAASSLSRRFTPLGRNNHALRSRECGVSWAAHLPWTLLGLRAAPKEDSGISSAELVYGSPIKLPAQPCMAGSHVPEGSATPPAVAAPLPTRLQKQPTAAAIPVELQGATHVYVRRGNVAHALSPPYDGPYVVRRRRPKSFDIFIGGKLETISVDRLKLHKGCSSQVVVASPPRRGRPRKI